MNVITNYKSTDSQYKRLVIGQKKRRVLPRPIALTLFYGLKSRRKAPEYLRQYWFDSTRRNHESSLVLVLSYSRNLYSYKLLERLSRILPNPYIQKSHYIQTTPLILAPYPLCRLQFSNSESRFIILCFTFCF